MKKKLLIYGGGAVGRGFIPWVFEPEEFEYLYVETNPDLLELFRSYQSFSTYRTGVSGYEKREIIIDSCFRCGDEADAINEVDAIVTAVGPRNVLAVSENLKRTTIPIVCCENDFSVPRLVRSVTENPNVVFGIPDVITSNTAPVELLANDPLSIVTEMGVCYVDQTVSVLGGNCTYIGVDEMRKQWLAKLYLHNTPHCVTAYLGSVLSVKFVHEAIKNSEIERVVKGAMTEMASMLRKRYDLDEEFIRWYTDKELARFKNSLLCDPVSRVAREPFRKLAPNERLIGAAQLCISCGVIPENIMLGAMAAFCYDNSHDPDANIQYLLQSQRPKDFLEIAIKLQPGEALYELMLSRWDGNLQVLSEMGS